MSIVLRRAEQCDAEATGMILSRFIHDTPWMPKLYSKQETVEFCATMIERKWMSLALAGQRVMGFLAKNDGYIHALFVSADARGNGIGHRLLRAAQMEEDTLKLWTFQRNENAQKFYMREGFVEVDRTDGSGNDEGLPDVHFQWQRGRL